jgi:GT2 family glycosyltransferase
MSSVTVIIVSWNSAKIIGSALESIRALDYSADQLQTVVVDNNSADDSVAFVRKHFPTVKVFAELDNLGFARGNNVGMRNAPSDYYAFVNPDVTLEPDWLRNIITLMDADPSIGIVGSKIFYGNRVLLQHTGGMLRDNLLTYHLGANELDIGQFEQQREIDYAMGAAFVARRSTAEALGYMSDAYFMYYEETEFCYRTRKLGQRVVYLPSAVAYHNERFSLSGTPSWRYLWFYHRSRYLFALRNLTTPDERLRFLRAEREWLHIMGRSQRYRLLLQRSKLAHWRLLLTNQWLLRV